MSLFNLIVLLFTSLSLAHANQEHACPSNYEYTTSGDSILTGGIGNTEADATEDAIGPLVALVVVRVKLPDWVAIVLVAIARVLD